MEFNNDPLHTLIMDESERQAVLMALANLAVDRPGLDQMLSVISARIDTDLEMYNEFKALHRPKRITMGATLGMSASLETEKKE